MLFFSHCFKSFHQFLSITNLQKTCIARNILWGFQIKTVETEIWGWTLVGFRNCLFAILCWQVAGEPMLFARGSSSWAFVRPIAEYRWGGRPFQLSCWKLFQQWQINATQLYSHSDDKSNITFHPKTEQQQRTLQIYIPYRAPSWWPYMEYRAGFTCSWS